MKKDLNEIAQIEKEKKYLKDLKNFYNNNLKKEETHQKEGFIIKSRIASKQDNRICPVCEKYSMESKDNLYMTKFDCCYECYIKYVEGREQRWKTGWRPNN